MSQPSSHLNHDEIIKDFLNPSSILSALHLAAAYWMETHPDPGHNRWDRAVYFEGHMALYHLTKEKTSLDYAVKWAEQNHWGLNDGIETRFADNHVCGQTYLDLYDVLKDDICFKDLKASIDLTVNSDKKDDWWWCDAIQMALPVFTCLGVVFNDRRYFDKAYDLYEYSRNSHGEAGLYSQQEHLWWRDGNYDPPYKEPNGRDCFWSRGNGWVLTGLARCLDILPEDETHRPAYIRDFKDMAAAVIKVQQDDGFWYPSLHDRGHFDSKETSGTALFANALAWGIKAGLLSAAEYRRPLEKAWEALVLTALQPNGLVGYVQKVGMEPKDHFPYSANDTADFGVGAFLLAGASIYQLLV